VFDVSLLKYSVCFLYAQTQKKQENGSKKAPRQTNLRNPHRVRRDDESPLPSALALQGHLAAVASAGRRSMGTLLERNSTLVLPEQQGCPSSPEPTARSRTGHTAGWRRQKAWRGAAQSGCEHPAVRFGLRAQPVPWACPGVRATADVLHRSGQGSGKASPAVLCGTDGLAQ